MFTNIYNVISVDDIKNLLSFNQSILHEKVNEYIAKDNTWNSLVSRVRPGKVSKSKIGQFQVICIHGENL